MLSIDIKTSKAIKLSLMELINFIINRLYYILDGRKKRRIKLDNFLDFYFKLNQKKIIIQVGGNDGINSDPIRKYLKKNKKDVTAIIFEPLDFYFKKLTKLYNKNKNIKIIKSAISDKILNKKIYFIDPKIVNKMDGNGPTKGWAHGQGSFSKEVIIHWIKKNSFRGKDYSNNIDNFINSIKSETIKTKKLSNYNFTKKKISLLLVDVQGFEFEVLKSLNWKNSPDFIIYEDDLRIYNKKSNNIRKLLRVNGYKYIGGKYDKIFSKQNISLPSFTSK